MTDKTDRVREMRNEILDELMVEEGEERGHHEYFHNHLDNAQIALGDALEAEGEERYE